MQHHHVTALAGGPIGRNPGRRRPPADTGELERLMTCAADGDGEAWAALVRRFTPRIRSIARAHRLGAHDAEDVVQATWMRLFRHIGSVRDPEKLGAWLNTTARRESLRVAIDARRRPAELEQWDEPYVEPECPVEAAERRAALAGALGTLSARQAGLLQLLLAEEEPNYAEVSERLEIPLGSIGPTRARALARLREDENLRRAVAIS
jgi:RNA polymerase sigma factor (sigma-70 family)